MKINDLTEIETPIISVIVPFINRERFLAETIESVISQTFDNWELLLVDDGSSDNSRKIADDFAFKHPNKIKVFSHNDNQNLGASVTRNLGLKNALGDFILFLDSDDILYPFTLEKLLKGFEQNSKADAVCGTAEIWYSWEDKKNNNEKDFKIDLVLETEKLYESPGLLIHNLNANGRKPHFNATLLKSHFIKKIGGFEEDFKSVGEDQALWAKVSLKGKIYIIEESLAKYRQHPDSTCANLIKDGIDADSFEYFFVWLENYLNSQNIKDLELWNALRGFKKRHRLEKRFIIVKQVYRRLFPLRLRYKVRDKITAIKKLF